MYTYTVNEAIVIACKQFMAYFVVSIELWTDDATFLATVDINIPKSSVHAGTDWRSLAPAALNTFLDTINASHPTSFWVGFDGETVDYNNLINKPTIPFSPQSYQAIISQTGTAAPTSSITPINTYTGTPTMTWARTGAGVYTLTASSAVFSTTKTGVFIAPLTNLNASLRAVVTSSTVITVTTAVQSVAILGLLGLTATNTDALLASTMIYVQTYP